jgi:hypothetical protein
MTRDHHAATATAATRAAALNMDSLFEVTR